jgi:pimeloyl-ACP methyl ester carboxylesterase
MVPTTLRPTTAARNLLCAFDHTGKVRRPCGSLVLGELRSLFASYPLPDPAGVEHGNGHVVLLVPGLFTSDSLTRPLRSFLKVCGYRAFGWGLGVNWGPTPRLVAALRERLAELRTTEGGPVSIVGVSLGGLLARDLAYENPHDVRQVITIASPFRLPTASVLEPVIRLLALFYTPAIDLARLATPLPVRAAEIYSRKDGIVAWESCRGDDGTSIEVMETHCGVCRNPVALRAVAQLLGNGLVKQSHAAVGLAQHPQSHGMGNQMLQRSVPSPAQ